MSDRQRLDVWLFRARLSKTRAEAARMIGEGGVRLMRDGGSRRVEKASVEVGVEDALLIPARGRIRTIRVRGLGARRGPPAEARTLYTEED
ncbi:MAG: RNA-binding S4 domain-containing protein [Hyphomonadaceae bacterium]|nr:RNA-binding S4 domain-containing protein [Hyphomonadaceae bacterium]